MSAEKRHEVTRLEGFSDAVFGFALTLLVVNLEVPQNFTQLMDLMLGFVPFALTFAMICWIWFEHRQFFQRYDLQDPWTVTVNCFLLFVVLFYVYPLKYLTTGLLGKRLHMSSFPDISQHGDTIMLMYSGGVVLVFGSFVMLYQQAWRKRATLNLSLSEQETLRFGKRGHVISASLGLVSIAVVFVALATEVYNLVGVAGMLYGLMGPLHAWNGYRAGKAQEALAKTNAKR
jgi:uncharacterized membrane protein